MTTTADLVTEADTALAALAASTTYAEYMTAWVKVEQALNTLRMNGMFFEADAGQLQFELTCRERQEMVRADTNAMLTKIAAIHADTAAMQAEMFPAVADAIGVLEGVAAE